MATASLIWTLTYKETRLIFRVDESFENDGCYEMKGLLYYVVDVTHDCRQYQMMAQCFKLFRIVCISLFERRHDSKELVQSSLQMDNVAKLWDSIWKCVVAHQCHNSFLVMATLLFY